MTDPIIFTATVMRIRTLDDGGRRVELNLGPDTTPQISALLECHRLNVVLEVSMLPTDDYVRRDEDEDPGLLQEDA